ncbi:MAG: DNA methyltransferase [Thermodesulfobacteriota bacterium]|nr:DNA methyltransferase [Thermodesulfobacteriota bacterium]
MNSDQSIRRAIEVGFPIVEINRLAVPERNSFKPIYQMHKWFARRASCVFRAILLGAMKPAHKADGAPTDLMEEFYKDHTHDPDTKGKTILDPFMGGGTTVVEALRLGCNVIGIDLNPVAWFIVKTEVEPIDLKELQEAFKRLAERPVEWNGGKPLKETLLNLYKTEVEPGIEANVIYTFWVKHAVCTDPNCKKEVPLFDDYIIAHKSPSVQYHPDVTCPNCGKIYDWEIEVGSLIADPEMMVNAARGSAGEGRPTQYWSYGPKSNGRQELINVVCPHCSRSGQPRLKEKKVKRKRVPLTVLLCPECEAVWQWRGALPEGEVKCPSCQHVYDPRKGNVPAKGKFLCKCGNVDKIIESIRRLPKDQRLPVRPYAIQAYLPTNSDDEEGERDTPLPIIGNHKNAVQAKAGNRSIPKNLFIPKNGKFFKRFTPTDKANLQKAEVLWGSHKDKLPYPKIKIPVGEKTKSGLIAHHYNFWHEMFFPRQLLALSTLLKGIIAEPEEKLQGMLLSAFFNLLNNMSEFCSYIWQRDCIRQIFARHDFQPKTTICENSVWGSSLGMGTFSALFDAIRRGKEFNNDPFDLRSNENKKNIYFSSKEKIIGIPENCFLKCASSQDPRFAEKINLIITDPPYVGNVNYAELADFFYVWLRLVLKDRVSYFNPEYTPKVEEIVENRTRGKSRQDFFDGLKASFARIHDSLPDDGLLVFTFHHTDEEGLVWEGLLQSLCDTGFEIAAVYPIHGESESSLHLMDKENISYDLIHVCRKRRVEPETRSWAGIRQEVRKKARIELKAIEEGRYGNEPLSANDVRLICIGKCLELYSRHYGKVVDHEGNEFKLHEALQDIGTIVDQLVTRERPLPPELEEDVDPISYAWLRVLLDTKMEINVNEISKALRAMQVNAEDLKKAGLIIKGRTGRGRYFKVKQPDERLNSIKEKLEPSFTQKKSQMALFDEMSRPIVHNVPLVDLVHLFIGLSWSGESVAPWLERFSHMRPKLRAALRFARERRKDWKEYIDRVLNVMEGVPLFETSKGSAVDGIQPDHR